MSRKTDHRIGELSRAVTSYLRPGAYSERLDAAGGNRATVRTDIAAFIGIAEKGPLDTPVPVESFKQFQAHFGGFTGAGYLAYAVRAFFENGGRRCWSVRIASREPGSGAAASGFVINDLTGAPVWRLRAANEGSWGNALHVSALAEERAQASVDTAASTTLFCKVHSVAGFARGELVCISQETAAGVVQKQWRVVTAVDPLTQRLYWRHPDASLALVYDRAIDLLDANLPARITNLTYRFVVYERDRLLVNFSGLSLVPEHPRYAPRLLAEARYPTHLRDARQLPRAPEPLVVEELRRIIKTVPVALDTTAVNNVPFSGGRDGLAALRADDFIGEPFAVEDDDVIRAEKTRGIAALDAVDEIALVAIPDIVVHPDADPIYQNKLPPDPDPCRPCPPPPEPRRPFAVPQRAHELPPRFAESEIHRVQAALIQHCEMRGDRFAVLDAPFAAVQDDAGGLAAIRAWRARFDSSFAALYYPWLKVVEPRGTDAVRSIPPSGHVLGQYAFFDNDVGVHRAPANRSLSWAQDLTGHPSFGQEEILNPLGINALRSENGRGLRVMGARTLSSDPDWRYINVRRLLLMVREVVYIISQWAVFEANHAVTRNKLQVALSGYLSELWSQGALVGASAEQAYFVKCDESNNPAEARANGHLLAQVGVAPSKPLEFVIVRVGMQANELHVSEAGQLARVLW